MVAVGLRGPDRFSASLRAWAIAASRSAWAALTRASASVRACVTTVSRSAWAAEARSTALSAQDLNKLRISFGNVRKELGLYYDIMVHCHNEYDLATAKAIPGAKLLVIKGMGHALPISMWPQIIDAIAGHAR